MAATLLTVLSGGALAWSGESVSGPRPYSGPYPQAAEAFRRGDHAEVERSLAGVPASDAERARLVRGLYAHTAGDHELAVELLQDARDPSGLLEDWRLFALAESLSEGGHLPAASAAIQLFQSERADSVLRDQALRLGIDVAVRQGDVAGAWRQTEQARRLIDEPALRAELAVIAWELAGGTQDRERRTEAARWLLVDHPLEASKHQVAELLRDAQGTLDWSRWFTARELLQRSRRLLEVELTEGALTTLQAVPVGARDDAWVLLQAEALTRARRGAEALALLAGAEIPGSSYRIDYLWRAAEAALDAAMARPGRSNLPTARREALAEAAKQDLRRIAALGDADEGARALSRLWAELSLDDDFDEAIAVLRDLRALAATDTTGAEALWSLGWREYRRGNHTGAIGTWGELEALYPGTRWARGGRYWSAAAHAALGNEDRARALWRSLVAADTEDFYSRHALARLGPPSSSRPAAVATAIEPWPHDSRLERARLLSDLGLDVMAMTELDLVAPRSDPRAVDGLRALVLERRDERRSSIHSLRRTFTSLGTAHQASVPLDARQMYYPLDFYQVVSENARRQDLSPYLLMALIRQESAFDRSAVSRSGARGLMQIMPATGQELAAKAGLPFSTERLLDPDYSARLGATYFRQVLDMLDGSIELALAGYNGGPYRIKRWWQEARGRKGIDEFIEDLELAETRDYVLRIVLFADSYRQLYGPTG